ncbi:RNA polymerase sigma factor, sigma-70 family [Mucilaginibacter pineti]|uniref:RNA polymerase sigma factor, sigma-70 family n=1 Tax=Mucilaginibacter pineti TaxID=1391627 RepID=A0A1G7LPE0_9SPHI|nr:sigma-70 family RNA polymerase sigma factor [Mucilaginibacter pineti]SDF50819.1 RNA polymerase sigma factor, sigma-70 family [Mucilaginibacter pineti]
MDQKLIHQLLWERLRSGDKDAFFDLYQKLYYSLVNFGIRVCADADISSEATDHVFTTIWEKHATLNRVDNVEAYLRVFLKRKLFKVLERKRKISEALLKAGVEGNWIEMSYEEFIVKVQQDEWTQYKLKAALAKLTYRQKQLIHLKFFEGLSYEQIASQTNQTIKTAYNTIYDALKVLRKEFNGDYFQSV